MTGTRQRLAQVTLIAVGTILVYMVLSAMLSHVAHAQVAEVPPPAPGSGWGGAVLVILAVMGGVQLILQGLSVVLHLIAPRTTNTVDDAIADEVDGLRAELRTLTALLVGTPNSPPVVVAQAVPTAVEPPRNPQHGAARLSVLSVVTAGALIGVAVGCAALRQDAVDAKNDIIDCTKADAQAIESLLVKLAADAVTAALHGAVDWSALESDAWAQGVAIGGCAYARFTEAQKVNQPLAAAGVSSRIADPAMASLERFRVRAGGVRWSIEVAQ